MFKTDGSQDYSLNKQILFKSKYDLQNKVNSKYYITFKVLGNKEFETYK